VVNAALTARLFAQVVASLVLGMTWESTKVLTIQHMLARVLDVVNESDWSQPNLGRVQIQLLTIPAASLAFLGTAGHWLITQFVANSGSGVLEARNLF
jgi:hypothetical protein